MFVLENLQTYRKQETSCEIISFNLLLIFYMADSEMWDEIVSLKIPKQKTLSNQLLTEYLENLKEFP